MNKIWNNDFLLLLWIKILKIVLNFSNNYDDFLETYMRGFSNSVKAIFTNNI